ncbi:penicillin-binding protein 2 [Candidatus Parcubacteria bacterium]|nr:MAG: penicillin-binding protein 2 [Candidatus Parcubacteria bacterium]
MVSGRRRKKNHKKDKRLVVLRVFFSIFTAVVLLRLFDLQVLQYGFYQAVASGQHEFYEELVADRGDIYVTDWQDGNKYIAVTNQAKAFIYADPRKINDPQEVADVLAGILGYEKKSDNNTGQTNNVEDSENELTDSEADNDINEQKIDDKQSEYDILLSRLSKKDDPYEPIAHNIDQDTLDKILEYEFDGIYYTLEDTRSYPEKNLGGQIFGFVRSGDDGKKTGQYGVEGYYNDFLAGENGFLQAAAGAAGSLIGVGGRKFEPAHDGGDIVLTIDRNIQYNACRILADGVDKYEADSGSLIIIEPKTGKVMAMCNAPDFDPEVYNLVEDISVFNNAAIFDPYEPGSVVKPLVMAAALDVGAVQPDTTYEDTGSVEVQGYLKPIKNSDLKAHGIQTMTQVLEKSLNTGMVFVMRQMGGEIMADYLKKFGIGTLTGIDLDTERNGVISSLDKGNEAFYAPASYGQGFTATLIQIADAYGALANQGMLMQPYIVQEKIYPDGTSEKITPKQIRQVINPATATTISAMLVNVIENGHGKAAAVPGYYLAGKTGTAQEADSSGGYGDLVNATFAGYGPIDDPRFVMVIRIEHPRAADWAADTAAPLFGEIADYILEYLEIPPNR